MFSINKSTHIASRYRSFNHNEIIRNITHLDNNESIIREIRQFMSIGRCCDFTLSDLILSSFATSIEIGNWGQLKNTKRINRLSLMNYILAVFLKYDLYISSDNKYCITNDLLSFFAGNHNINIYAHSSVDLSILKVLKEVQSDIDKDHHSVIVQNYTLGHPKIWADFFMEFVPPIEKQPKSKKIRFTYKRWLVNFGYRQNYDKYAFVKMATTKFPELIIGASSRVQYKLLLRETGDFVFNKLLHLCHPKVQAKYKKRNKMIISLMFGSLSDLPIGLILNYADM